MGKVRSKMSWLLLIASCGLAEGSASASSVLVPPLAAPDLDPVLARALSRLLAEEVHHHPTSLQLVTWDGADGELMPECVFDLECLQAITEGSKAGAVLAGVATPMDQSIQFNLVYYDARQKGLLGVRSFTLSSEPSVLSVYLGPAVRSVLDQAAPSQKTATTEEPHPATDAVLDEDVAALASFSITSTTRSVPVADTAPRAAEAALTPANSRGRHAPSGPRHPCTRATAFVSDRYQRKSMVIFPIQFESSTPGKRLTYKGISPTQARLKDDSELLVSVAQGLLAVDYPLERFDSWLANSSPNTRGDRLGSDHGAVSEALSCVDAAVVPRIVEYEAELKTSKNSKGKTSESYEVSLQVALDLYQRRDGALVRTKVLKARAPGVVDHVEDMMSAARASSVNQLASQIPLSQGERDRIAQGVELSLKAMPPEQAEILRASLEQTGLAVTRVASVARPFSLLPVLDGDTFPVEDGLGWRSVENKCYLDPPTSKDSDFKKRLLECEILNRTRQAIRAVQLDTRKVDEFRLYAPLQVKARRAAAIPLGREEGLRVGDGYFVMSGDKRVGYLRTRALGPGGHAGEESLSSTEVVFGNVKEEERLRAVEHPKLGLEIGLRGGALPARREEVEIIAPGLAWVDGGAFLPAGELSFDVNLGRMTRWYEGYQTNRLAWGLGDSLRTFQASFGVEKRLLVAPRVYVLGGGALSFMNFTIPTGIQNEEGNEIRASAARIGPEVELGTVLLVSPSLLLRASVGGRAAKSVREFKYSDEGDDERQSVTFADPDFKLVSSGLLAHMSAAWVF